MGMFDGRVIFITGASSGIGKAAAQMLAAEGGLIAATDLGSPESILESTELDERHLALSLDVTDEENVRSVVRQIMERFGRLDCVVASAGIVCNGAAHDVSLAEWQRGIAVHLTGAFLTCKYAVEPMKQAGSGSIVTISSVYGMTGCAGNIPYNAAKGGVLQLMRSLAADYAQYGIRVNAVSPGLISTPMTAASMGESHDAFVRMHLLGRPGTPEEVAAGIHFLLSDAASFITGVNLPIDGGFSGAQSIPWEKSDG